MPANQTSASSPGSFLAGYQAQLSALEQDPNATPAFKAGLQQQFAAVQQQVTGQAGAAPAQAAASPAPAAAPTASQPTPAQPSPAGAAGLPTASLPAALQSLAPNIEQAAQATGESASLIAAQIWQESRGASGASTSNGGTGLNDAGLMQVDAATFQQLQQEHPQLQGKSLSDPLTNIEAGSFDEQDLKKQFGSDDLALRAYNSGPGSVDPGNANTTTTGLGDPTYVQKVDTFQSDIMNGTTLPA